MFLSFSFAKWHELHVLFYEFETFHGLKKDFANFLWVSESFFFSSVSLHETRPMKQAISGLATAHLVCYYRQFFCGTDVIVPAHPKLQKWWPGWNVNIETYSKCQACQSSDSSQIHSIFFQKNKRFRTYVFLKFPLVFTSNKDHIIKCINLQRVSPCFWRVFCWRRSPG